MGDRPDISQDKLEQIENSISTSEDLLKYAQAKRYLANGSADKRYNFLKSESFYKFLGVTFGIFASVFLLIVTQFFSISRGAIDVVQKLYSAASENLDTTNEQLESTTQLFDKAESELTNTRNQLSSLNKKLTTAQGLAADTQKELNENTKALQIAEQRLGEQNKELEAASKELAKIRRIRHEQIRELAVERLSGTTLYACEKSLVHPVFDRTSINARLEPPPELSVLPQMWQMSMRIYVLKQGKVAYASFSRAPGQRFSARRAGDGVWELGNDRARLELSIWGVVVKSYEFRSQELLEFSLGSETKVCSIRNECFWKRPNCLP
ncbi:MAG: hypothetical protein AB8B58_17245 [Roseobacter sp.]